MKTAAFFASLLMAACSFSGAPPSGEAPVDYDCRVWSERAFFDACEDLPSSAQPSLTLDGGAFDTKSGLFVSGDEPRELGEPAVFNGEVVRLIFVESFTLTAQSVLRITGELPLVIASLDRISIEGEIDASSDAPLVEDADYVRGPGADPMSCPMSTADAEAGGLAGAKNQQHGGGGGGGGGFAVAGGAGGRGGVGRGEEPNNGGVGGDQLNLPALGLRGGCPGGHGGEGDPDGDAAGGRGGAGGGTLLLSSVNSIEITGTAQAGGAGGLGQDGPKRHGGGGGGSGGLIAVEAASIVIGAGAIVAANGGGGGGGSDSAIVRALVGEDAEAEGEAAVGGVTTDDLTLLGNGGLGDALRNDLGSDGSPGERGGGGGGGGGGFVLFVSDAAAAVDESALVSPAAQEVSADLRLR